MHEYHRVLTLAGSGGWVAQVFEIPWCVVYGETPSEAMRNLDEALEWAIQHQNSVPSISKGVPQPLSESEWGDLVGKRPEDLSSRKPNCLQSLCKEVLL